MNWSAAHAYARSHSADYQALGRELARHPLDDETITKRVAFAILSANATFESAVSAWQYCRECAWQPVARDLARWSMVSLKAQAVSDVAFDPQSYLREPLETWTTYRWRLARDKRGLGLCKASFAGALLYPMEADVCCIDTHLCQGLLGSTDFIELSRRDYETQERRVRRFGAQHGLPCFLAQWLLWDFQRGRGITPHEHLWRE